MIWMEDNCSKQASKQASIALSIFYVNLKTVQNKRRILPGL